MNKLLITGAAGFIGSNFVRYWFQKYPQDYIIALDALTYAGNKSNLKAHVGQSNFKFIQGSICDQNLLDKLFTKFNVDCLVHFAAESHVDRSIDNPDAFITTNVVGTHHLLESAKKHWLEKGIDDYLFHHVSTDEVYGSLKPTDPAFTETSSYAPNSPYAASKAASDHLVRAYYRTYGLKVTTSNCSNNYGPFQFPEKLIPLCLLNILNGKLLPIYGEGTQVRDWLYVDDHCRGIELILKGGKIGETYNIGGNNEWRNIEVVQFMCEAIQRKFRDCSDLREKFPQSPCAKNQDPKQLIAHVEDRLGHDTRYAINADKVTKELNYNPTLTFEEGLKKTIDWYLENEFWWRAVLDGSYMI
tara:strand:- start:6563 stop:7636 length:1074 start_codon:yes stop_codon:yes gene_type:complete